MSRNNREHRKLSSRVPSTPRYCKIYETTGRTSRAYACPRADINFLFDTDSSMPLFSTTLFSAHEETPLSLLTGRPRALSRGYFYSVMRNGYGNGSYSNFWRRMGDNRKEVPTYEQISVVILGALWSLEHEKFQSDAPLSCSHDAVTRARACIGGGFPVRTGSNWPKLCSQSSRGRRSGNQGGWSVRPSLVAGSISSEVVQNEERAS